MGKYTVTAYNKDGIQIDETYQPIIPELIEFIENLQSANVTSEKSA